MPCVFSTAAAASVVSVPKMKIITPLSADAKITAAFLLLIFSSLIITCHSDLIITDDDGYSTEVISSAVQDNQELMASDNRLRGKVLRVLVVHFPPLMIIYKRSDGTMQYGGVALEILDYTAKALDIRKVITTIHCYELVFLNLKDFKKFGYRTAQANAIKNDEADIAPSGVPSSIAVYERCDQSIPWLIQPFRMIVPWPEEQTNHDNFAAARPFDSAVWICLGGSLAAMACVLTCLSVLYEKCIDKGDEVTAAAAKTIDSNSPPAAKGQPEPILSTLIPDEKTNPVKNRSLASQKNVTTVLPKLRSIKGISSETFEMIINTNTDSTNKSVKQNSNLIANNSEMMALEDVETADDTDQTSPSIFHKNVNFSSHLNKPIMDEKNTDGVSVDHSALKTVGSLANFKHRRYPEPILKLIQEGTYSSSEEEDGMGNCSPTRRQPTRVASASLMQHYAVVIHPEPTSNSIHQADANSSWANATQDLDDQTHQPSESSKKHISNNEEETTPVVPSEMGNNPPLIEAVHQTFVMPDFTFNFLGRNTLFVFSHLASRRYEMSLNLHLGILIAVGCWCLMVVVLANSYTATLLSFLSVTKLGPAINSLGELANTKSCQLIVQGGSDVANYFLSASNGTYKMIGDSLRENPENVINKFDRDVVKGKLMNGSHALVHIDAVNYGLIDATYRQNGNKCRMTLTKETVGSPPFVVTLFAKNSPYTEAYNKQLQRQIEAGLIDYNVRKYMPRIDQCKMENQKGSANFESLTLRGMSSAFIVLIIGVSLATLAFLIELVFAK